MRVSSTSSSSLGRLLGRRPWLFVIVFVAALFAADRLLATALEGVVRMSAFRLGRIYSTTTPHDAVVLGDSRGVNSFPAASLSTMLCLRAVNLAYNGLPGEMVETFARDYIDRHGKPKLILLEISSFFSRDKLLMADFALYASMSQRVNDRFKAQGGDFWYRVSHLHRFYGDQFLRNLFYFGKSSDQGWVGSGGNINQEMIAGLARRPVGWVATPDRVELLRRFIHDIRGLGIEPFLYLAPYHPAVFTSNPAMAGDIARVSAALRGEGEVHDFSRTLSEDRFFADPAHMNETGRQAFAAIAEKSLLPERGAACGWEPGTGVAAAR